MSDAPADVDYLRPGPDWRFFGFDRVKGILEWAKADEDGRVHVCTQHLYTGKLLDENKEAEIASNGQSFGNGKIVARVPEHLAYKLGLMDAVKNKDKRFIAKILNDSDYRGFRTFRGQV